MGSANESEFVRGDQSVKAAYRWAVDEARYEHGSDGYNGTISTSSGFRVFQATPVTWAEAYAIESRELENLNKWEDWGAVAVLADESVTKRTVTKQIRLDVPQLPYSDALIKACTPLLSLKAGETVSSVKVTADEPKWTTKVHTPEGDRQVKYVIRGRRAPTTRFDTLAAARGHAVEAAKTWGKPKPGYNGEPTVNYDETSAMDWVITGTVDRGVKDKVIPMLNVVTEIKSRKLTIEAEISKAAGSKMGGWYFFGWAAC